MRKSPNSRDEQVLSLHTKKLFVPISLAVYEKYHSFVMNTKPYFYINKVIPGDLLVENVPYLGMLCSHLKH